ncbi:uncharacterized protein [Clytia hemisphaerica]|uniref:uncharacterized protein n=1 Tax=Clytia hemisphaerica TaxID=252671 RepID=UPI0034D62BBA
MNRSRPFKFSVSPPNTNTKATTLGRKQQLAQSKLKNVLDVRVIPGHPQQAWVECYDHSFDEEAQEGIAELHAHEIHKKYEKMKLDRDQKLKDFQTDVNQRVRYLEKMKRKQMKLNTMKKEEEEQNVILQRTLGLKVPYRGTVEDLRALNKELLKSCIVPSEANKQLIKNEIEKSNRLLTNTCSQVSHDSSNARKSMLTKKISVVSCYILCF